MAVSKRKFYQTTFKVVVLSEDNDAADLGLSELAYECFDGEMVGSLSVSSVKTLDGKQAARALLAAHSEPGFFRLNDAGEDDEEE